MKYSHGRAELNVPDTAKLHDVYKYTCVDGDADINLKWRHVLHGDKEVAFNAYSLCLTLEMAIELHKALGEAIALPLADPCETSWLIASGEKQIDLKAEREAEAYAEAMFDQALSEGVSLS